MDYLLQYQNKYTVHVLSMLYEFIVDTKVWKYDCENDFIDFLYFWTLEDIV